LDTHDLSVRQKLPIKHIAIFAILLCHLPFLANLKMTIFDGSYKLESSDGLAAGFAAMGIPDDDTKNYLKSEVIYTLHEKSPGCFEYKNTCSLLPAWNMSNCVKVKC